MTIIFEKEKNIARITLNRPDVHNAFNAQMIADLNTAFEDLENSSNVDVVIISGNGASFSAGADLEWMKLAATFNYEKNVKDAMMLSNMLNSFYSLKQLTVVCAKGAIMGGGVGLVSCADVAIADQDSKFAFSEVKLGLIPATISPFVIKAIGARQSKRYFQTGEIFDAEKALQIGLVHETSTSIDDLDEMLETMLYCINKNAPTAMKEAKKLVLDYQSSTISDDLRGDTAIRIAKVRSSMEAIEGLTAFLDKRDPDWKRDV